MQHTLFAIIIFILGAKKNVAQPAISEKINGVNFVSPKFKSKLIGIDSIKAINANWIALCPFSFLHTGSSKIDYNTTENWWGDRRAGIIKQVSKAKKNKLKVLIKPHFWLMEKGWAGDFDLSGEMRIEWEQNYEKYLLYLAKLSDSLDVEMLAIGTELKTYTTKHPDFFTNLIEEVRKVYKGKLTYAANWDEYNDVKFWDKLDYIGIDAYFPLSNSKTPGVEELKVSWDKITVDLRKMSIAENRKIIFTEYGYKSINYAAYKQWEFENTPKNKSINLNSQANSYTAFYNSIWKEDFMEGGFLWKWYNVAPSFNNSDYTPQGKPILKIIKNEYSKN